MPSYAINVDFTVQAATWDEARTSLVDELQLLNYPWDITGISSEGGDDD